MRLWSLHPRYLDRVGLLALWREGLLAQKVLQGATRGYRHHPQLQRFRAQLDPLAAIGSYLREVASEGERRGYAFDRSKIGSAAETRLLSVTDGQLRVEMDHLRGKLRDRDPARLAREGEIDAPVAHPLFEVVPGPAADWERRRT